LSNLINSKNKNFLTNDRWNWNRID